MMVISGLVFHPLFWMMLFSGSYLACLCVMALCMVFGGMCIGVAILVLFVLEQGLKVNEGDWAFGQALRLGVV